MIAVRPISLVLASALLGLPLGATTLEQLSLGEMSRKSTAIVRARITGVNGVVRGADVSTVYHVQVLEQWKGAGAANPIAVAAPTIEVSVPGGVAGGMRQMVPGSPALAPGQEYVLFLWTGRSGVTQVMGLSQGIFRIAGQTGRVWRAATSEQMLDHGGHAVQDEALSMSLDGLKVQVSQALRGNR